MEETNKLKRFVQRYRLTLAISAAIVATLGLTVISVALYNITGSSKLDLSRPGYNVARKQLKKADTSNNDFKSDGPITTKVVKDYLQKYQKLEQDLNGYDGFDKTLLSDKQLGLTEKQISPNDGARQP